MVNYFLVVSDFCVGCPEIKFFVFYELTFWANFFDWRSVDIFQFLVLERWMVLQGQVNSGMAHSKSWPLTRLVISLSRVSPISSNNWTTFTEEPLSTKRQL